MLNPTTSLAMRCRLPPSVWEALGRACAMLVAVCVLALVWSAAFAQAPASQGRRMALLIGNYNYSGEPGDSRSKAWWRLDGPKRDVPVLAKRLRELGFEVDEKYNLTGAQMYAAVNDLARRAGNAQAVLVFYAGHGASVERRNYLVPADAGPLELGLDSVMAQAVLVDLWLAPLAQLRQTAKIVLLDACRGLPVTFMGRGTEGQLVEPEVPSGMVIGFSAAPGKLAVDSGAYVRGLLKGLAAPEPSLLNVLVAAADEVKREVGDFQRPNSWGDDRTKRDFWFAAPRQGREPVPDPRVAQLEADLARAREQLRERETPPPTATAARPRAGETSDSIQSSAQAQAPWQVKIGSVGPLSGAQAHYGRDNLNGVRMAVEELNARGVNIGGRPARFEVLAEDDGADPQRGQNAAQRLCDANANGVVGHLNSGTTIPASAIYNRCGIPHITPSATNPRLTQQGFRTTFRLLANDNELGAGLARLAASVGLRRVAVIDDRTAYGAGVATVFKQTALARGMQVVSEQYTTDKSTDFRSILQAIKGAAPDAIFYGGMDTQLGPMLRQMDQMGLSNVRVFGGDGTCTKALGEMVGNTTSLSNFLCVEGGALLRRMPGGESWKARYDTRYPGQFQVYSPFAYDATLVLVDAMIRAGSADPRVFTSMLFSTDYQGITQRIRFESDGELVSPAMTGYRYVSGQKQPLN